MADKTPFWRQKPLSAMSAEEWDSLCDGCGKCCLYKLEDEDTLELYYTNVACRLLDLHTCRCTDYAHRQQSIPDCIVLTPDNLEEIPWLPATCAYRLLSEGQDLPWWHPLVSGDPETVHTAGISIRGRAVPETKAADLEEYVVDWLE